MAKEMSMKLLVGEMMGKLDAVADNQDKLYKDLYGNGRKGLIDRTLMTEEHLEVISKSIIEYIAASNKHDEEQNKQVGIILETVREHHSDKNLHGVWGMLTASWKGPIVLLAAFVALHYLAEEVPVLVTWFLGLIKVAPLL